MGCKRGGGKRRGIRGGNEEVMGGMRGVKGKGGTSKRTSTDWDRSGSASRKG